MFSFVIPIQLLFEKYGVDVKSAVIKKILGLNSQPVEFGDNLIILE